MQGPFFKVAGTKIVEGSATVLIIEPDNSKAQQLAIEHDYFKMSVATVDYLIGFPHKNSSNNKPFGRLFQLES